MRKVQDQIQVLNTRTPDALLLNPSEFLITNDHMEFKPLLIAEIKSGTGQVNKALYQVLSYSCCLMLHLKYVTPVGFVVITPCIFIVGIVLPKLQVHYREYNVFWGLDRFYQENFLLF